jgi:hypothetical protein
MPDFLQAVDTDGGPREPVPVTLVSGGLEVALNSGGGGGVAANGPQPAAQSLSIVPATDTPSYPVAVSNFPATQTVSVSNFPATQPISAAALPLPSGAATLAQQQAGTPILPSSTAAQAIAPVVAVNATALVVKASAGNFYGASIVAGATAGFLIAYNTNAVPPAGSALTAALSLFIAPVAANGVASVGASNNIPDRFSSGVVLLFSTSATTYTVPANPAIHLRGRAV